MEITEAIQPDTVHSLQVREADADSRLDKYIDKQFPFYSRSFFQRLIEESQITINGKTITKPSYPVKTNDSISIHFPPQRIFGSAPMLTKDLGVEIVHEHDHFIILYKPAGLIVHPASSASTEITLVDWLVNHYDDIRHVGYVDRPGIVHRLDKGTSGLLIIPRTNYAHMTFGKMFKDRSIKKRYLAIVHGHPEKQGSIDLAIGRHPMHKNKMTAVPAHTITTSPTTTRDAIRARNALTNFSVVEYFDEYSLIELQPVTGRTHQIRVHCAAIGHPLLGDQLYGKKSTLLERHALHAHTLSFIFEGQPFTFSKEMPTDMRLLIETLRKNGVHNGL